MHVRNAETILTFRKLLKSRLFDPVDEPALASTTIHDHAEDLCASELCPLRI